VGCTPGIDVNVDNLETLIQRLPDDFGEDSRNPEEKKDEQTGDG